MDNFAEAIKMNQSMRKSNSWAPRLPGSLGEVNALMNYNNPQPIITCAGQNMLWRHRQCAVLVLHKDAEVTTVMKQKSVRKIRPADQWTQRVFQAQWPWWVTSQKVSREQRGRTESLHCSGCFVSPGSTDSHKFQSLQVKTPIVMRSSMSPHPALPPSTQLS